MVRLAGPAMSVAASGKLGGVMVFSNWKGRAYARQLVTPSNPQSVKQVAVRSMMRWLSQQWAALTAGNQATWEELATSLAISPFNAYCRVNLTRWRNFTGPTKEYPAAEAADTSTLQAPVCTLGVRSITVVQTPAVAGNAWGVAFFRNATGVFTRTWDKLVHIGLVDGVNPITFVDTPLAPGQYFYECAALCESGTIGDATAEDDETVV